MRKKREGNGTPVWLGGGAGAFSDGKEFFTKVGGFYELYSPEPIGESPQKS